MGPIFARAEITAHPIVYNVAKQVWTKMTVRVIEPLSKIINKTVVCLVIVSKYLYR